MIVFGSGLPDDPLAVREIRTVWRDLLRQGISVVALNVDSEPQIAGVNILHVVTADDEANSENLMQVPRVQVL